MSGRSIAIPEALRHIPDVEALPMALLAPLTTFRIGGPADVVLIPHTVSSLEAAVVAVRQHELPLLPIGAGSNLLVSEAGFRGVAIKIGSGLSAITVGEDRLRADAGRTLPELMRRARREGLSGLEFAGGIPGSLGGALRMNAGAWQREMSGIADWVRGINLAGEVVRLDAAEIQWGYRTAVFPEPLVIIEAALRLVPDDPEAIGEREDGWHEARRRTQPLGEASAGCVFKNPPGQHASQLIEAAGLKGERIGGAVVSPVHANFIVNTGGATADQVVRLVERVRERVRRAHGVELDLEVQMIGITAGGGD